MVSVWNGAWVLLQEWDLVLPEVVEGLLEASVVELAVLVVVVVVELFAITRFRAVVDLGFLLGLFR